tara:strand:- start:391 stop:900 length:510 start_codon:yes stop_codon:yes gene_type:complete
MNRFLSILTSFVFLAHLVGCKTEGCTDPKANNFSYEAEKDDGSCDYGGCMDVDALNYDPDAKTDNGTCKYNGGIHFVTTQLPVGNNAVFISLKINGGYIGSLAQNCTAPFPSCTTTCAHVKFTDQTEGFYSLQYWKIKQVSSSKFDTLFASQPLTVTVIGGKCDTYLID